MNINKLKINPNNPQKFTDLAKLEKSIKEFPKMMELRPLVIDSNNMVLGGNKRLICIQNLGMKEIPDNWIKKADELTEDEKKRFIIADNVGFGEWDWDVLSNEWDKDLIEDWGLETDGMWHQPETKGLTDDDAVPEVPEEPITKLGDLWILGEHRLLCGDSTDIEQVERLMDGNKADMVFTDPPYGMSYGGGRAKGSTPKGALVQAHGMIKGDDLAGDSLIQLVRDSVSLFFKNKKDGGAGYVCFTWRTYSEFETALEQADADIKACVVWDKKSIGLGQSNYRPQHEFIFYCKGQWYGNKGESDVWYMSRGATGEYVHPTQKPVELIERAVNNSSKSGDMVSDAFLGSGSTLIACEKTNRKCYGMEIDPHYCDVTIKRWEDYTGNKAVKQ